ncbi:type I-E CRISPR-associated protein Cse1/CasA [Planomonospora sp. ID67723]|uniref:type I-E CRISPR-associated protein Cse1/CasA n=1 Tax=Planomonospora sp. ID67723 TaxID=2738134 RepID=UPI0018C41873|nr:type I-E CRISPR-associated protein Cse1/CasA [Planomonospora sp. ID67723]MBG0828216.1 type I-E CRISPR-associated protein Cse1/CasA [Planomonospora sp. ID67723]
MTYDLVTRDWLPVRAGEARRSAGLRQLFEQAHELTDIEASPPPGASGLWRVLTVIAARITGLDDVTLSPERWGDLQAEILERGRFDRETVEEYFARYADRFDLFDARRPWLQDPRLREQCKTSSGVNKLVVFRPAGNNQVWFNHATALEPHPLPAEEAVFHLLTQLYYGPSGQCTPRVVEGTSGGNSKAGPLRRTISFHPLGRNVFESLVAGIPPAYRYDTGGVDLAPWEADDLPDSLGVPPRPSGLGGVLTGRFQHAVLLERSDSGESVVDAWITWAWRDKELPAEDPYLVYQQNKDGDFYARQADASRALWRDFDALLLEDAGDDHRRRPAVLAAVEDLCGLLLPVLRVRAFGFDQDGQTRDKEWTVGVTPALLALANETQVALAISDMRQAAEKVERHLRWALRDAWIAINDPSNGDGKPQRKDVSEGPWPAQGSFRYWARAERIFWRRVRERGFDHAAGDFLQLALDVYDEVTDSAGALPRAKRAVELKRGLIFAVGASRGKATTRSKTKEPV